MENIKSNQDLIVSVITPTFNRAYILPQLYDSLVAQTNKQFEWLVVDDGSTDETEELINGYIKSQNILINSSSSDALGFPIRYYKKENGGKCSAFNYVVPLVANTGWLIMMDSDDYFLPDAIEKLLKWMTEVKDDSRFLGVSGRRGQSPTETISAFPSGKTSVDASDLDRDKKGLRGDKTEIWRKDIIKNYPFPEFKNEKFMFEATAFWDMAADGYIYRFHSDIITIQEYIADGLTKNIQTNLAKNFLGYTYFAQCNFKYRTFPLNYYGVGAWCKVGKSKGLSDKELAKMINTPIIPDNYNETQAGKINQNFPKISLWKCKLIHLALALPKKLLNPKI